MGLQEKFKLMQNTESRLNKTGSETLSLRAKRIEEIKRDIHSKLIDELSDSIYKKNINDHELKTKVTASAQKLTYENDFPLTHDERSGIVSEIIDDVVGYGPIEEFLRNREVTEIMINNPNNIYIEKFGKITKTTKSFIDE